MRRPASRGAVVRLLTLGVLLAVLGTWAVSGGGPLLADAERWVDSLGLWGPLVFALVYALAVTALLPGSVLAASAGALLGVPLGVASVLAGATVGAALSFGVARWLGRPAVEQRFTGIARLARLDARLSRHGFAAVLVPRLVPLFPFGLVNYGAGVLGVRCRPYLAATALGIAPGTLAYVALGGALRDPGPALLWVALAGLVALSAGGWWVARRIRSRSGEDTDAAAGELHAAPGKR